MLLLSLLSEYFFECDKGNEGDEGLLWRNFHWHLVSLVIVDVRSRSGRLLVGCWDSGSTRQLGSQVGSSTHEEPPITKGAARSYSMLQLSHQICRRTMHFYLSLIRFGYPIRGQLISIDGAGAKIIFKKIPKHCEAARHTMTFVFHVPGILWQCMSEKPVLDRLDRLCVVLGIILQHFVPVTSIRQLVDYFGRKF